MPKISVLIPLYNKAPYIRRALDSVFAQTEQDFEIVVVDDGSTDDGGKIVQQYADPRIKYFRQVNLGVSAARNTGIKTAGADFIAFLDGDDEYRPQFLETVLRLRKSYPQAGIYSTAYVVHESDGIEVKPGYQALPPFPWEGIIPDYFESALGDPPVETITAAIPRTVFEDVGYFPAGEKLGEDSDTWFRIALKYPVVFSNYEGAVYHREAQNRSNSNSPLPGFLLLAKTARNALRTGIVPEKSVPFVKRIIDEHLIRSATHMVIAGRTKDARDTLTQCQNGFYRRQILLWYILACIPSNIANMLIKTKRFLWQHFFSG